MDGTQTAGGSSRGMLLQYVEAGFGQSGYFTSGFDRCAGGGGGWYGGGCGRDYGGGGGSGFVLTEESYGNVPTGYLLSDEYFLEDTYCMAGNEQFMSPNGALENGHQGNGFARITRIME